MMKDTSRERVQVVLVVVVVVVGLELIVDSFSKLRCFSILKTNSQPTVEVSRATSAHSGWSKHHHLRLVKGRTSSRF
jgi:hypothetical protein